MAGAWQPLTGASHQVALEILLDGPLSRAELSKRVRLSPGSLTRLTKPMLESGLLVEVTAGQSDPRVGRPSQPLDIVPTAHHFVGIKLTGDTAVGVLTTLRAEVIATEERKLPDHAPESVASTITTLAESLAQGASIDGISGIGISLGGQVVERATVRWGMFLDWEEVPLGDLLRARTDVPAVVANDITALTEATHWFGAGRGVSRFCLLTIGAGIGYGLVVHDKLVDSGDASLGLIGHHPLIAGGPRCDRGHEGCASALLTTDAVVTQVGEVLGRAVGYEEALDLAAQGDDGAKRVIDRAGFALGKLVAAAANLTLPERIVIGGEGVRLVEVAHDALLDGLHVDRHPAATDPELVLLDPDFSEWARGAAVIAIQTFVLGS
ncbi:putative NBD/HSP70 family sugar kinase [Kribbella sp. VKM Ac-2527]|uniref:Putative NBD/HSP70 family sugar kinase n=1 Tax=Kribbella caucasensis TaxID=2512215 RepID=A0A4R6KMK7_9ACTN|nr:ROK family transcriptional regulator [Kribbella sp. VKM Ac-2527]TDO50565.1 putative NBD/HSP70 family sugar kinase [Kribbella sp. VKM Ac-2527]